MQPQPPPPSNITATAARIWALIDERIQNAVKQVTLGSGGVTRPRPLTITVPITGTVPLLVTATTDPVTGLVSSSYLTSVSIFASSRIIGWELHALTAGIIVVDLLLSTIQIDPTVSPKLTPLNGSNNFLAMNGFTTGSQDTSGWSLTDIPSGGVINVFIVSADGIIAEAVLGLQLSDLDSMVTQV